MTFELELRGEPTLEDVAAMLHDIADLIGRGVEAWTITDGHGKTIGKWRITA